MANYYFHASTGDSLKAVAHSQYILAEGKYKGKKSEIAYTDINLPSWAKDTNEFWNTCAEYERTNARAYREYRFSLPNELSLEENKKIVNDFIEKTLENRFYYVASIHDKNGDFSGKENRNIHCHLMFSEKEIDGIERIPEQFFKRYNAKEPEKGGAKKIEEFKPIKKLYELRKTYEEIENSYYEKNGFDIRVSCKSLKDQREDALLEGDQLRAEMLDREPINIRRIIAEKKEKNRTSIEQEAYEAFQNCIKVRDIKVALYKSKLSGEMSDLIIPKINSTEDTNNLENKDDSNNKNIEIEEVKFESIFDEYISNEKDIMEINKKLRTANRKQEECELLALFKIEKDQNKNDAYNVFRNKENLERKLLVMDNFNDKNGVYFNERQNLEEKIYNFDLALEIRIEKAKEIDPKGFNRIAEKIRSNGEDDKLTLGCSKVNLENRNIEIADMCSKEKNGESSDSLLESQIEFLNTNVEYNLKLFVSSVKELKAINSDIKKIESQLEKLDDTTMNKITKGEYSRIEKLKEKYSRELTIEHKNVWTGKIIDSKGEKGIARIELEKLVKAEGLMYKSLTTEKYNQIKNSIEIKLKEKLINLKEERELISSNVSTSKSNLVDTKDIKKFVADKIKETRNKIDENRSEKMGIYEKINEIKEVYTIENINKAVLRDITEGKNEELIAKYNKLSEREKDLDYEIRKIKSSLNPFKIIERNKLINEKAEVSKEIELTSNDYRNLMDNISEDNFVKVYSSYAAYRENKVYEFNRDLSKIEDIENKGMEDYRVLRGLEKTLENYNGISERHEIKSINFNKLMDHSATGGGGQEVIESFFDDLERQKRKERDKDRGGFER